MPPTAKLPVSTGESSAQQRVRSVCASLILLLVVLACRGGVASGPLAADDFSYALALRKSWSVENGLPQVSAVHLAQDHDGFVWIATESGLARFDGYAFRVYNSVNTPVFTHEMLRRLHVDAEGHLWVASAGQLLRRDGNDFVPVRFNGAQTGGHYAFAQTTDGTLWVGGDHLYRAVGDHIEQVGPHAAAATALLADGATLWIGSIDGIGRWDGADYHWFALTGAQPGLRVTALAQYEGALWAATNQGLFRQQGDAWIAVLDEAIHGALVHLVHADRHGNLWISTDAGLLRVRGNVVVETVSTGTDNAVPWVVSALDDRDGHLWLGSQSHGLLRLRQEHSRSIGVAQGLPDPNVWSFLPWGAQVLAGTGKGVAVLERDHASALIGPELLPNPVAYSLYQDGMKRLWVGTRSGLARFDGPPWQRPVVFPEVRHLQVNGVLQTQDRSVWVATAGGLYRLAADDHLQPDADPRLRDIGIRALLEDPDGSLWIGTEQGLYRRGHDSLDKVATAPLDEAFITVLKRLDDGRLLVGTFNHGLVIGDSGRWNWIRPQLGLPARGVMFAGQAGDQLLLTFLQGVYRLDRASLVPGAALRTGVLIDNGSPGTLGDVRRCCNGGGPGKGLLHNDTFWLPSLSGVVVLAREQVEQPLAVPQAVIEGLGHGEHFSSGPSIQLKPGERNWRFEYAAPVFVRSAALRFNYRLDGYDPDWVDAGSRREAFYTNLPPGDYRFRVRAMLAGNSDWSDEAWLAVQLQPQWYETWLARVAAVALLLMTLWGLHRTRIYALSKRQRQLERLVAERTQGMREANAALARATLTDPLTGLYNRRYLDQNLGDLLARVQNAGHATCWMLIDIDHFKDVNDRYGHDVGDRVLAQVASILRAQLRESDHALRWGGEEFLVVMEDVSDPRAVAGRLGESLRRFDWQGAFGVQRPVSCSIGIACYPARHSQLRGWGWQPMLSLADKAMYQAKRSGRDHWLLLQVTEAAPADLHEQLSGLSLDTLQQRGWIRIEHAAADESA